MNQKADRARRDEERMTSKTKRLQIQKQPDNSSTVFEDPGTPPLTTSPTPSIGLESEQLSQSLSRPSPQPNSTDTTTETKGQPDTGDLIIEVTNGARLGSQIKVDIGRIGGQLSDSGLRSIVHGYSRCVSPTFETDGDAHFPRSLYKHATNPHNSAKDGFGNVLIFHIGAAIMAYYGICRKDATAKDLQAIDTLHRIAERGASSYKVFGTTFRGFRLEPMPQAPYMP